jgi:RecB family exonuclease
MATIIYSTSNSKTPSPLLYEFGLKARVAKELSLNLLYNQKSQIIATTDPIIDNFDATNILWSASKLKTFLTCRRKYYYTYEQKLRAKEDNEINEGQFLHKLLENLFKKQNHFSSVEDMQSSIDRLLDEMLLSFSPKITYSKLLWREKLKPFIKNQIKHFKADWRVVKKEEKIKGSIGGVNFRGVVDRIDQNSTHTYILDYKSGSIKEANRTKNLEKLKDFQMSIYYELLKYRYQNIDLAFVELFNSGSIIKITELEAKTELLHQTIGELKEINSVVARRCDNISDCQYCDFILLCERGDYLFR